MKIKSFGVFFFFIFSLVFSLPINACTGFGIVIPTGTLIGKNRDYYYLPQQFDLLKPLSQFKQWYNNPYQHNNQFYALTYGASVSMGINQHGLTAIEEDILSHATKKLDAKEYGLLQQQQGMPDGHVLYAILQNFNTVDEMRPYLSKIFTHAAPDFYQFADAKKILTVEVAYRKDHSTIKPFTYKILSKKDQYFAHTNTYINPAYVALDRSVAAKAEGADYRLKTITALITHSPIKNIDVAAQWFMDTRSNFTIQNQPNSCLSTSIFRSDLQQFQSVNKNVANDKIFGTLASMIVQNTGDFKTSYIYVMMLNSITLLNNGDQLIKYNKLQTTLQKLFSGKIKFTEHTMIRNAPVNGVCK